MLSRQVVRQAARLSRPALASRPAVRAPFSTTRSVRALSEAEDPDMVLLHKSWKTVRRLTSGRMVATSILLLLKDNTEIPTATGPIGKSEGILVNLYTKMKIFSAYSLLKTTQS